MCSHSGAAGAVPGMDFEEKLRLYNEILHLFFSDTGQVFVIHLM